MRKKLALAAAALALAVAAPLWFAPFQTLMTLRRFALWRGGVHRVALGPLLAYEKSACRPGAPCRCVALVHGLGDSAMTWDKTMLGGADAARPPEGTLVLAVDMPGTDGSAPTADYGIRSQARVLRAALQTRCPEWTVVGNSLGGWIAGWLALDWPEGVKNLILVDPAGLKDPSELAIQTARLLASPTAREMEAFSARAYAKPPSVPARAWPAVVASIKGRPPRQILAALKMEDTLDARLKDMKAQTVILWGAADGVLPADFPERFRRGIPGARLVRIPDCGHLPQQECPQAVSRELFGPKS